jgi:excisionase family DNA binding protein
MSQTFRNTETSAPFFDLPSVLARLNTWPKDRLPDLFGQLAIIHTTAQLALNAASQGAPQPHDELLAVDEAASRLGMSRDYLYRHAKQFPFTRREGRSLRFSAQGIQSYIQKDSLTVRQHRRSIGTV